LEVKKSDDGGISWACARSWPEGKLRRSGGQGADAAFDFCNLRGIATLEIFAPLDIRKSHARCRGGEFCTERAGIAGESAQERFVDNAVLGILPDVRSKCPQERAALAGQMRGGAHGPKDFALETGYLIHVRFCVALGRHSRLSQGGPGLLYAAIMRTTKRIRVQEM
jgi:hypothetical protein